MTHQEFIKKYNGKGLDYDGYYGYQCMDLMHFYVREVFGLDSNQLSAPTAYESYKKGGKDFDTIEYKPGLIPEEGDILYWNTSVGFAGHVAICMSADTNLIKSFDQNWPVGSLCHEQQHDYSGIAGWLRPFKNNNMTEEKPKKENSKLKKQYEKTKKNVKRLRRFVLKINPKLAKKLGITKPKKK